MSAMFLMGQGRGFYINVAIAFFVAKSVCGVSLNKILPFLFTVTDIIF